MNIEPWIGFRRIARISSAKTHKPLHSKKSRCRCQSLLYQGLIGVFRLYPAEMPAIQDRMSDASTGLCCWLCQIEIDKSSELKKRVEGGNGSALGRASRVRHNHGHSTLATIAN